MKTIARPKSAISAELLDQLLAGYEKPEDLTGDAGDLPCFFGPRLT